MSINKKKIIAIIAATMMGIGMLSGCNKSLFDTTYHFDRAIIQLPDGKIVDGKIESWTDFDDGDQIQVKIDGKTYLVHSSNIVLMDE